MNTKPSPLYNSQIANFEQRLSHALDCGLKKSNTTPLFFFRADDIGVPSTNFAAMTALFRKYKVPLCLAVVPAWLTAARVDALRELTGNCGLFCWHQHGWTHTNHELAGKKQEFGDSRARETIRHDLIRGKERLSRLLGDDFFPAFTPPWNRCGETALSLLPELGFKILSRSSGATPDPPGGLPDIQINVDLHTRKETRPEHSAAQLFKEIESSLARGQAGVMLHHQKMNSQAFAVLEQFLRIIRSFSTLRFLDFRDMP